MTSLTLATVQLDITDGLATLTLNDPANMNVMGYQMGADLKVAISSVAASTAARALLICATGNHFCGGGDLKAMRAGLDNDPQAFFEVALRDIHTAIKALWELPIPVVCAVQGYAAGAGANFALVADIILAADNATFYQAFTQVGVSIDSGGTWLLPRAIGDKRALYYLLTGAKLSAGDACGMGLISKVVPQENLQAEARKVALQLADGPTKAYAEIRRLVASHGSLDFASALDAELAAQIRMGGTMDFQAGVKAFLAKETPTFRGQ